MLLLDLCRLVPEGLTTGRDAGRDASWLEASVQSRGVGCLASPLLEVGVKSAQSICIAA